jgi:uncharacterized protein YjbI with pentapeptide repeats
MRSSREAIADADQNASAPPLESGDYGLIADEHDGTESFRGATFREADFTGATFRACELRNLKVVDSLLVDVNISGIVGNFVVNDVDVTAFVETVLERRHPERAQLRQMQTPDEFRAM